MISICLPNLNNRPYLRERIQTIIDQTWQNWELIIVDNHSEDGAWEFFQTLQDPRIHISQAPRCGMYQNWNNCIELARGEYVYIATSDDTMQPDCIETMVHSLECHPECGIAHSNLIVIDEMGNEIKGFYETKCRSALYFRDLIHRSHIRRAPHDGLLHYYGGTVYVSITQLLIRKALFDRVGLFRNDLGSAADFEWEMRATLEANTVHVPRYLASWRIHNNQATSFSVLETPDSRMRHLNMSRLAWNHFAENREKHTTSLPGARQRWETVFRMDAISLQMAKGRNSWAKLLILGVNLVTHPLTALHYLYLHLRGKQFDSLAWIDRRMKRLRLDSLIDS